jgi:hypothetical protein
MVIQLAERGDVLEGEPRRRLPTIPRVPNRLRGQQRVPEDRNVDRRVVRHRLVLERVLRVLRLAWPQDSDDAIVLALPMSLHHVEKPAAASTCRPVQPPHRAAHPRRSQQGRS